MEIDADFGGPEGDFRCSNPNPNLLHDKHMVG